MNIKLTIIDAIKKLNEFAMEVNLDSSTDALIFVWTSPHCFGTEVMLFKDGWHGGANPDIQRYLYYLDYKEDFSKYIGKSDYEAVAKFADDVDKLIIEMKREVYPNEL